MNNIEPTNYILIDDLLCNILANPCNSILISPYTGDKLDRELQKLSTFLINNVESLDIRSAIPEIFDIKNILPTKSKI